MASKEEKAAAAKARAVAIRADLAAYVASRAADASIENDPRYFAALSSWCYKRDGDPADLWWQSPGAGLSAHANDPRLLAPGNDKDTGYDGGSFYHVASRALIIINRGSETERDWIEDAIAYFGLGSRQMDAGLKYATDSVIHARAHGLNFDKVILSGQSLGAGLVQGQHCCLDHELGRLGHPPAPQLHGLGFASAGFEGDIKRMLAGYGVSYASSSALDAAFPTLRHWVRKGDPIRILAGYLTNSAHDRIVGQVSADLPDLFTISRNPKWMTEKHGAQQFLLTVGRAPAHDSYRYWLYFDRPANQCVVINPFEAALFNLTTDMDYPLASGAPPNAGFNTIPKDYRRP